MRIIQNAPENAVDLKIVNRLKEIDEKDLFYSKAIDLIKTCSDYLDLIGKEAFSRYTLHDKTHSRKILYIIENIIPDETLKNFSEIELYLSIAMSYIHDITMVVSKSERKSILSSKEFNNNFRNNEDLFAYKKKIQELYSKAKDEEKSNYEDLISEINEVAITNYLRPLHTTRDRYEFSLSKIYDLSGRNDFFLVNGFSFSKRLIDICESHGLRSGVLAEVKGIDEFRFPREEYICGYRANIQFLSSLLRVADVLDFDYERTPKIIFENIGLQDEDIPGTKISLNEWKKHLSVHTINIKSDEILIVGQCTNPSIEAGIISFSRYIEEEIRDIKTILRNNKANITELYKLELPSIVKHKITSEGYVYKDISLNLNQKTILNLLMGNNLYHEKFVCIRELIQNAIDATLSFKTIHTELVYKPEIAIKIEKDDSSRDWIIINDNGIGMDEHVLMNYFFKIGNSYYHSVEFDSLLSADDKKAFFPISKFGIGILSSFMISDLLIVETCNNHSIRNDKKTRKVFINDENSLAYLREYKSGNQGTKISLRLKKDLIKGRKDIYNIVVDQLKRNFIRPEVNIKLSQENKSRIFKRKQYYFIPKKAYKYLNSNSLEMIEIHAEKYSTKLEGRIFIPFVKQEDGKLSYLINDKKLQLGQPPIRSKLLIEGFSGTRVTVKGILVNASNVAKLFKDYVHLNIPLIIDINMKNSSEIELDVARTKIIGESLIDLKKEIFMIVDNHFTEKMLYKKLSHDTKDHIQRTRRKGMYSQLPEMTDKNILRAVQKELPEGNWPVHIHKRIAEKLDLSNSDVASAISTMIDTGIVRKPI